MKSKYIFVLALLFLMSACNSNKAASQVEESGTDESTVAIEHAMGVTEINEKPKRIVSLYQGATDSLIALDISPVGVVESWNQQPMYDYLKDNLEEVTYLGLETQPNLEEISKLKPDLIIASKVRHEDVYEQLSKIAPTVTTESVDKFKETLELIGKSTGETDKSDKLINEWSQRVTDFSNKMSEEHSGWPYEISVINFRSDHARIYTGGFSGNILNELGFLRNDDQTQEFDAGNEILKLQSTETISSMNADIIFMFNHGISTEDSEATEQTYRKWTNHPSWENLDAVKDEQIYKVNEITWNLGGGYISANLMLDELYDHFEIEK